MITLLDQRLSAFIDSNIHNNRSFDPLDLDAEMMKETGSTSSQSASTSESKPLEQQQQQQQEVNIPVSSYAYGPPPPKLALRDLLSDERDQYRRIGVPLYEASIKCDWTAAEAILRKNPDLVRYALTGHGETALHIASSIKRSKQGEKFVRNLVDRMYNEDLELQNMLSNTALFLAASSGNIKTVKIMVQKNRTLTTIAGSRGTMMPLYAAAMYGNYEVVKYLYENSNNLRDDGWNSQNRGSLFEKCAEGDMLDIALDIKRKHPELDNGTVLAILARKPDAFSETNTSIIRIKRSIHSVLSFIGLKMEATEDESTALTLLRYIWEDTLSKGKREADKILMGPQDSITFSKRDPPRPLYSRVLFIAAKMGNTNFLVELIRQYPDLIWKVNLDNQTIFHVGIEYRHESIYNLLYEIGPMKDLITPRRDENYNTMLHLAGKLATKERLADVSGAALQMQRELLWFKEVQSMVPPSYRELKNKDGLTPRELFTEQHKELIKDGERWMKETASQCMVVAALIATIVFAAAFTVPGGYNLNDGIPIFYRKAVFVVFVVADAMSLFLSSASILTFLSILTSRFAERDFEESLPRKLMLGLLTLFLSIATMVITFSISFFILYHEEMKWIPILMSVVAVMPVLLYIVLQYHVLADVIRSSYGSRYLFKPDKQVLYYVNTNPQGVSEL